MYVSFYARLLKLTVDEAYDDTLSLLARYPVVVETYSAIKGKRELDAKIEDLEDAITTFSRHVVYVKNSG